MNRHRIPVLAAAAVATTLLVLPAAAPAQEFTPWDKLPDKADFVVHEWGTFTSMVGRDGVALEGLHHEEEALPKFVHDLLRLTEVGQTRSKLPASRVTQKMETPVIYFYSDEPMRAQVDVWFIQGLMSQFYPLPDLVQPTLAELRQGRIDMSKVDLSALTWRIELIPHHRTPPKEIPVVAPTDPWAFARQTGAAYVRTQPEAAQAAVEAEHYLFYRGLGRWNPKLDLRAAPGGRAAVTNGMAQVMPFTLLLELGEAGGRFVRGPALEPGATHDFDLADAAFEPDRERFARQVGAAVLAGLTAAGLYPDEARAMVATWSRSWFQTDGARLIYLLPREQVDQVLPLSIRPVPKELLRVLVGRHEFITPEAQTRVEGALRDGDSGDPLVRDRAAAVLSGLDRFLEPHLRNVVAHGQDAAAVRRATALLAEMTR